MKTGFDSCGYKGDWFCFSWDHFPASDLHEVPSTYSDGADGAFKSYLGRKRKDHNLFNKQFAYDSAGQSSISLSHN